MCIRDSSSFFKQKTAYEIMPSLVGSEMCIRDRSYPKCIVLILIIFGCCNDDGIVVHPYPKPILRCHLEIVTHHSGDVA